MNNTDSKLFCPALMLFFGIQLKSIFKLACNITTILCENSSERGEVELFFMKCCGSNLTLAPEMEIEPGISVSLA